MAILLAYSFYSMDAGWLRYLMVALFSSIGIYQGLMVAIHLSQFLKHGTWYSEWSKVPFTIAMVLLTLYIYQPLLDKIQHRCLNFLTQLRKSILK